MKFALVLLAIVAFVASSVLPADRSLTKVTVALKQRNLDWLEKYFWAVSDPKNVNYGKYLTRDQIADKIAPTNITAVTNFLTQHGAQQIKLSGSRDFITCVMNVQGLTQAFSGNYAMSAKGFQRSGPLVVPNHMKEHIHLVVDGLHPIQGLRRQSTKARALKNIAPAYVASDAGIPGPVIVAMTGPSALVILDFVVFCADGSINVDDTTACSSTGNAVKSIQFTIHSYEDDIIQTLQGNQLNTVVVDDQGQQIGLSSHNFEIPKWSPTINFEIVTTFTNGKKSSVSTNQYPYSPSVNIVPQVLGYRYSITMQQLYASNKANSQSVAAFGGQYFSPKDAQNLWTNIGFPISSLNVIGPNDPTNPGEEATLDVQYITGTGTGANTTFWSIAGDNSFVLEWAQEVTGSNNPPLVHSISYGLPNANISQIWGDDYISRTDVELQKLGARGVSVITASGDAGVYNLGRTTDSCLSKFQPSYPANSPYITSVGATYLTPNYLPVCYQTYNGNVNIKCADELVGDVGISLKNGRSWTTGGGFSDYASTPSYQKTAVNNYLQNYKQPPTSYFDKNGRGFPDVSMAGHNFLIVFQGQLSAIDGTSASAPAFAGLITLINDARLNANKKSLGFLNPFLYGANDYSTGAYFDVVLGENSCGTDNCCPYGFNATVGWDAVGGLGAPNLPVLLEYAMTLP